MAEKKEDKEEKWNPTQALPDEDDELEAKKEAARRSRVDYLKAELDKRRTGKDDKPKKSSIW